jgi:hypothetical protein
VRRGCACLSRRFTRAPCEIVDWDSPAVSPTAQLALYGILLAGFFLAALWRPAVALAALLCMYGLKQWGQTSSAWLEAHGTFTNYAIGTIVLCALVVQATRGNCVLCNVRGSTRAVMGLYAYALLSLLWTPRPDLALNMWQLGAPYIITAVMLAPLAVHDSADLYRAYFALLVFGGVLVVALLFLAKWGDRGVVIVGGTSLELETNPLSIANLGGAVASAAMFLRTRKVPILSWTIRLLLVAASLALVVKSGSRGQLVATVATLILMLPVAFEIGNVRGLVPILVAVAVVGYAAQYAAQTYIRRDDDRWSQKDAASAAAGRWQMSTQLLEHWSQSPGTVIFGLGNSAAYDPNIVGAYPHNVPAEVLGEEGMVGLAIYLGINWLALKGLLTALRATKDDAQRRRLLAVAGANYVFTLITSLKEGNMAGSAEFFMAAILLARMPEMLSGQAQEKAPVSTAPATPRFANMMR